MTRRLILLPAALNDMDDIWEHTVGTWSAVQADRYMAGLDALFLLLRENPEIARLRQEFSPRVRVHPCRSHLVIFEADETELRVIRVMYGRSDWEAALQQ